MIVNEVVADAPAAKAGLKAGDVLVAVDGHRIGSFQTFQDAVRSSEGRALAVEFVRAGVLHKAAIAPLKMKTEIIAGVSENIYRVGIAGAPELARGAVELERVRNPLIAIPRAVEMTKTRCAASSPASVTSSRAASAAMRSAARSRSRVSRRSRGISAGNTSSGCS